MTDKTMDKTIYVVQLGGNAGVMIRATATIGKDTKLKLEFDESGKVTNLPTSACFDGIKTQQDFETHRHELISGVALEVLAPSNDAGIVVVQRASGRSNRYVNLPGATVTGELTAFTFPPTTISRHFRSPLHRQTFNEGPVSVWTTPMNDKNKGANRIDTWHVGLNGDVDQVCTYFVTDNDGKSGSWRLIDQVRWTGRAYKRRPGSPDYVLKSDDKRVQDMFKLNEHVRRMFNEYVFVPGPDTENIEARSQVFMDDKFRAAVDSASLGIWEGPEDFWSIPSPGVPLKDNQGVVKFHTWGVGEESFGIIIAKDGTELSFSHRAIPMEYRDQLDDDHGNFSIPPGTVVTIVGEPVSAVPGRNWRAPKVRKIIPVVTPVSTDRSVQNSKVAA